MEFEESCLIISKAIEQTKSHQIDSLMRWLDGTLVKYRESGSGESARVDEPRSRRALISASSSPTAKLNHGQRFSCACGRSFSAEITIRETTNVDASSPPATPMLLLKNDLKQQQQHQQQLHQQHGQDSMCKRPRMLMIETSVPPTTIVSAAALIDRSNSSSLMAAWQASSMKNYENSPGAFLFSSPLSLFSARHAYLASRIDDR